MKNRVTEIDCLKGIGMLLVILQHCISVAGGTESRLSIIILSFHMPLFFFASGFVYKPKEIKELFSSRMATLLGPVVLYSLLNVLMRILFNTINHGDLYSVFAFAGFWFLLSLLWITVFQYILEKYILCKFSSIRKKIIIFIFAIVIIIVGILYSKYIAGKEVTTATALVGWGFYLIGIIGSEYLPVLRKLSENFLGRVAFSLGGVIGILVLVFTTQLNKAVFMYLSEYGNGVVFLFNALIGLFAIMLLSWAIKTNSLIEFFGKNSLVILLTHFPVHHVCVKAFSIIFDNMWVVSLLGFISTCLVESIIVMIINRFLPALTGKIKM